MNNAAGNLAIFLLTNTGSIFGKWTGKLNAAQQRDLFGQFIGRGTLVIDGSDEMVRMYVKTCFGQDSECTARASWLELECGKDAKAIYTQDGVVCR